MARRRRRKPRNGPRRIILAVCRDCSLSQPAERIAFFHAARPRCTACGGLLDRLGHLRGMSNGN